MLLRFEEISNNAWPALQTIQYDGWLIRLGNGVTKRSNSVTMLYPSTLDPSVKVDYCEKVYLSQGITPCFKVTEISTPGGIDGILEEKGYFIHSEISFQCLDISGCSVVKETASQPIVDAFEIRTGSQCGEDWIDEFIRMNGFDKSREPVYRDIMKQMITPKCIVSVLHGEKTVAVGLGVLEEQYVGLFDIVVDPEYRRKDLGRLVVDQILGWGRSQGAETAYLQVLCENQPAISLYQNMGFREAYRYWYRMKGEF